MIVAVTGTGTGIGKTHLACALLGLLRDRGTRALGWKPVESGVADGVVTDEQRLRDASEPLPAGFATIRLAAPLAPNLAARRAGIELDGEAIVRAIGALAARHDVVLELAGGLFSPLTDELDNAAVLARLPDPRIVLVAPDRLGVLHDVAAALRAARAMALPIHAIALAPVTAPDASTGHNAPELAVHGLPVVAVPHAPAEELRRLPALSVLLGGQSQRAARGVQLPDDLQ